MASNGDMEGIQVDYSQETSALEKCGSWLLAIPRDNVRLLHETPEYSSFMQAFERLGHAHRREIVSNQEILFEDDKKEKSGEYSFLQHLAVDDVIMRIFEFLECGSLARTSMTCHRFCSLAFRSAEQRTQQFFCHSLLCGRWSHRKSFRSRIFLGGMMHLLRAEEQISGVRSDIPPFVTIPMWGLPRRIRVTHSGDEEYNGIYFCTGTNGNGFLFTKPRPKTSRSRHNYSNDFYPSSPRRNIQQCIISKRFSNENVLWYMSKEIEPTNNSSASISNRPANREKPQQFSFWAELLRNGEASEDECRYPSQTSVLSRNGARAWQALEHTVNLNPPIVELIDS